MSNTTVPEGFFKGPNGILIPEENVGPMDKIKDEFVETAVESAKIFREKLKEFKAAQMKYFDDINALMEQEYKTSLSGKKGNATVRNIAQDKKVIVQISDRIELGPELRHAKQKIDELLQVWMEGSNSNICKIIEDKFKPDTQGNINIKDVLSLKKLEIDDDSGKWEEAMKIIDDSINIVSSARFIRFYECDEEGIERQISLDIAKL